MSLAHSTTTNMKKIASLILSVALASSAFAGPDYSKGGKDTKVVPPTIEPGCACFGPGFDLGIYGGGALSSHKSVRGDGLGGGALAEYFFTENFGIQGSYGAFGPKPAHHIYGADFVVRFPIKSICIAPYIMAGGDGITDGVTRGDWNAGLGVDVRIPSVHCMAVFADGAYHWTHSSLNNFTLVRLGVKFPF